MKKEITYRNYKGEMFKFTLTFDTNTSYTEMDKIVKNTLEFELGYVPEWWYS